MLRSAGVHGRPQSSLFCGDAYRSKHEAKKKNPTASSAQLCYFQVEDGRRRETERAETTHCLELPSTVNIAVGFQDSSTPFVAQQ